MNKKSNMKIGIVGGEHSQFINTLKQAVIESQNNPSTLVVTRDELDEMLLVERKNAISDCLEIISEDVDKVNDINKKAVYVNLFNRIEKLRNND